MSVLSSDRRAPSAQVVVDTEVASAQVKSAVVLAARAYAGAVVVREPRATRDHTERMIAWLLARPGADGALTVGDAGVALRGPLTWEGFDVDLPGDPSSAALVCAYAIAAGRGFVADDIVTNVRRAGFWRALGRMGVRVDVRASDARMGEPVGAVACAIAEPLRGVRIESHELADLIDEVPALVVVALHAHGSTRIEGAGELRVKESDRLALLAALAHAFGARAAIEGDALVVEGPLDPRGPVHVRTDGDHRIAMAAIALGRAHGIPVVLDVDDAAHTSFPGFQRALRAVDGLEDDALPGPARA